jgi:lipid-binding SYLF domain-containing protein
MQLRSLRLPLVALAAVVAVPLALAARPASPGDEIDRVQKSIDTLKALTTSPDDGIPQRLLAKADAVVVIPSLVKGGFVIGAKHGRGVMSARDRSGAWSAPAFVKLTGGSIGWQIGVESVDLVLLVMNPDGVDTLLADKFTFGGNLSATAGPVGRAADAGTDGKITSQILAYSRAKGLFAGATFEGAALRGDDDSNEAFYGAPTTIREVMDLKAPIKMPSIGNTWRELVTHLTSGNTTAR